MKNPEKQILESLLYDMECLSSIDVEEKYSKQKIVDGIDTLLRERLIEIVGNFPFEKEILLSEPDEDYWDTKFWFKITPKGKGIIEAILEKD